MKKNLYNINFLFSKQFVIFKIKIMKLQKSNGTHSLANLNQPHPKKIEIARLRPKVNNFVLKSKMTETS
jgi:hypothetical protein